MDDEDVAFLQVVASTTRHRILDLLGKGVDHPEDLARRLKLRRQSVDKQLVELYAWGLVDRSAVFPADGRPRIVYRISDRGKAFLEETDRLVASYRKEVLADFRRSLDLLEKKLADGELDEEAYLQKRQTLEARYARFYRRGDGD